MLKQTCAAVSAVILTVALSGAQEIRRALPVNEPPTPPAVPFDFDATPTPTPRPRPTPLPAIVPPVAVPEVTPSGPPPDQAQIDFANGFYARKIYDAAAPEYEKYLGLYPTGGDRPTALFRLGESYRLLGNATAAKTAYQTLLSTFNTGDFIGPAAFRLADLHYAEKNFASALVFYRRAAVRVKDPAVALAAKYYTARCLEQMKAASEARGAYEEVLAAKGDNPFREASRVSLAQILTSSDKKEEALKQLDALQKETSKPALKAEALVRSGLLRIELGAAEKGAADLNKALKIDEIGSYRPIAELGLLRVLYETGKYSELLTVYQDGTKDYPADLKPEVLLLVANAKRQMGDHTGANEIYQQLIKAAPDSAYAQDAAYQRLVSLYNLEDPTLVREIDAYLKSNPDSGKRDHVLLLKAETLFKQQKYAEAAPVYDAIEKGRLPANMKAEAVFKLGWCAMQTNELDRAIESFTSFIDANPDHKLIPSALAQRAVALQQKKDFKAALKDFNELVLHHPKAKERELALQQKALILGQQQDNTGMAETFKKLLQEFPKSAAAAQANYWIGWAAFDAKDYKAAIEPFEKARDLDAEQFAEKAALRIMLAHYYLENRDAVAADIGVYLKSAPKGKVPSEVLRWLGAAYVKNDQAEEAGTYLSQLVTREGETTADDLFLLGRAQLGQKKHAEAAKSLRAYLDSTASPTPRALGLLALAEAQLGLGQFDDAQHAVDEACTLQPEGKLNAQGRMLSGDIAAARGELDQASRIYRGISVILDDPEITPRALEKAYRTLKKAGNDAEAAKVLNDLQTRYPEYRLAAP